MSDEIDTLKDVRKLWTPEELVYSAAIAEIGNTDPKPYYVDVCAHLERHSWPVHWCGIFALYCLHEAGIGLDWEWQIEQGFLWRLELVDVPRRTDIAYFPVSKYGGRVHHHAIVEDLYGHDLVTIDGNTNRHAHEHGQVQRKSRDVRIYSEGPYYYTWKEVAR